MWTFLAALTFAVAWGIAENRLFREQDVGWEIFDHFKPYHLFLVSLTMLVAFLGCEGSTRLFLILALWTPWMLDIVWWKIRYYDFKTKPDASVLYNGETNAWHRRLDWDNCPLPRVRLNPLRVEAWKPPIIGCFWWWWVLGGLLVLLAFFIF